MTTGCNWACLCLRQTMQMLLMVLYPGISQTSIPKKVRFSPGICPLTRPRFLSYPRMRMLCAPAQSLTKQLASPEKHIIASLQRGPNSSCWRTHATMCSYTLEVFCITTHLDCNGWPSP